MTDRSREAVRAWWAWANSPVVITVLGAMGLGWSLYVRAEMATMTKADQDAQLRIAQLEGAIGAMRDGSWQDRLAAERRFGSIDSSLSEIKTKLERLLQEQGGR